MFFNEFKTAKNNSGLIVSYGILNLVGKLGNPYTIEEKLILPFISAIICTVMGQDEKKITGLIPLSNSTVSRKIVEMTENVEA